MSPTVTTPGVAAPPATVADVVPASSYLDWALRGASSPFRYVVGLGLAIIVFFVLSGLGSLPLMLLVPDYQRSVVTSVIAKLLQFVIAFAAIPLLVRVLHRRPAWSVAMPAPRLEARNFLTGLWVHAVAGLIVMALASAIGWMPLERNPDFDPGALRLLAVVGFAGIFVQAGAEELLFRGYLAQFVRRLTASRFAIIGVPAVLFAAPHVGNLAAFGSGFFTLAPYLVAGLLYGWAAWRSGSLWMSLGLHVANNYTSLVLVGTKGDVLPSAAPFMVAMPALPVGTAVVLVQSLATALLLALVARRTAQ